MQSRPRSTTSALALIAVATLVASAGCASSKSTPKSTTGGTASTAASATADPSLAALVPQSIKSAGSLSFATDASYAPNEYLDDNGKIIGFDIDFGTAVAAKLGLTAKFTNVKFDNILGGVQSGNYDAGISSFTDSKDREGKGFEMVTYFTAGTKLMVQKGNPEKLAPDDLSLCGKKIGVESGTVQEDPDVKTDRAAKCAAAGKPAPIGVSQQDQTSVNTSLQSARVDAVLADSPVVDYYAKTGPFDAVGASYGNAPYGIAVWKDNDPLAKAILAAVKALQADGTYHTLTSKWGISSGEYTNVGINQATS